MTHPTRAELIKLAARVEALQGPCREVDAEIALAVGWVCENGRLWWPPHIVAQARRAKRSKWGFGAQPDPMPPTYTASLDAAATLLPDNENLSWQIESGCGSDKGTLAKMWSESSSEEMLPIRITASTPAIAICAAALRARAAIADADGGK